MEASVVARGTDGRSAAIAAIAKQFSMPRHIAMALQGVPRSFCGFICSQPDMALSKPVMAML